MLAPVTHILPLTTIRRNRVLPAPGRILVHVDQKVSAVDDIAQADIPSGHVMLDIRRGLRIPKVSEAERCIVRQEGDNVEKGDVVAETGGMFSRIVRAPLAGEVVAIRGGQVLLSTATTHLVVKAGFSGTVTDLIGDRGATIETNGALVQGMWGNGQIDSGLLILLAESAGDELVRDKIDVGMRGAVVLGGRCSSAEVLRAGAELPLRGLVLSSMTADLLPVASSMNYPIFLIEGFGNLPLDDTTFRLLASSDKRDVSVNATYRPETGERPELVIPLPAVGQPAPETDYFGPGQTVRIQGAPYAGKIGSIVQVQQGMVTLPCGIKAQAAEVELDKNTRAMVPLANLEGIE
jgi:hypothetical protein